MKTDEPLSMHITSDSATKTEEASNETFRRPEGSFLFPKTSPGAHLDDFGAGLTPGMMLLQVVGT